MTNAPTELARVPTPRELQALIQAERAGLPFLRWHDGGGEERLLTLTETRSRVTIGRREHSDLALTWDKEVSRAHAILEPVGGEWTLVDDGLSSNGSYVNGSRVRGRQRLHDRDRMCFGATHVVFREPGGDESDSTARADGAAPAIMLTETQRRVLVALCRPVVDASSATPATNPAIAAEVFLTVDAVKSQLRGLFDRFGLGDLPQNEKRGRLVATVLTSGVLAPRDF